MNLHIKGGRVIDPASGRDAVGDVFVSDGKMVEALKGKAEKTIDAKGLVVCPGFIDLAVRLREPGGEYKATLESISTPRFMGPGWSTMASGLAAASLSPVNP